MSRDESRAVTRRLYDGAIGTGRAEDVDALAETYLQNTGWTFPMAAPHPVTLWRS
jgi:hypothetical protein